MDPRPQYQDDPERVYGLLFSGWKDGKEIVSLHSGFAVADETRPWTEHSLVPVYSATKGASSAALLLALHRQGASPQLLLYNRRAVLANLGPARLLNLAD